MILAASDVTKVFSRNSGARKEFIAVQPTNLTLEPGEIIEICGQSGSGKSTLLSMMAGLLRPTSGQVLFDGENIYALDDDHLSQLRNDCFGIIPQAPSILASLSVAENILLPLTLYKKKNEDHYAKHLLEMLGIYDLAYEMPTALSGGQIRRVSIARSLVAKPQFVFADEPTGDLDEENTQIVLDCLRAIADEGASVLLVTHDSTAINYQDRLYVMNHGMLSVEKGEEPLQTIN